MGGPRQRGRAYQRCHRLSRVWIRRLEHVANQRAASHLEEETTKSSSECDRPRLRSVWPTSGAETQAAPPQGASGSCWVGPGRQIPYMLQRRHQTLHVCFFK